MITISCFARGRATCSCSWERSAVWGGSRVVPYADFSVYCCLPSVLSSHVPATFSWPIQYPAARIEQFVSLGNVSRVHGAFRGIFKYLYRARVHRDATCGEWWISERYETYSCIMAQPLGMGGLHLGGSIAGLTNSSVFRRHVQVQLWPWASKRRRSVLTCARFLI